MIAGTHWTIAEGVCSAPLSDHLLIGAGASAEIRLFNSTGAQVWLRLQSGDDAPAIARNFVETFGLPLGQARADVEVLLHVLEQAGLIFDASAGARELVRMPLELLPDSVVLQSEDCHFTRCTQIYRLGNRRFCIEYRSSARLDQDGQEFIDRIVALFSGISETAETISANEVADGLITLEFCVGPTFNSISGPGIEWNGPARINAYTELCSYLLRAAYGPIDWLYRVHAASVACEGGALLLPAPAVSDLDKRRA